MDAPTLDIRSYGGELGRHRHPFHQCVLPDRGTLEIETGAGSRRVGGSCGLLIPAGEFHAFRAPGPNRFVVIDFVEPVPGRALDRALHEPAFVLPSALAQGLDLFARRRRAGPLEGRARRAWTEVLLDALDAPDREADAPGRRRFRTATEFIRRDPGARLDRATVAATLGMTPDALTRLFRRHAGCGVGTWIADARLAAAAERLVHTDDAITAIALDCGFSEHSALTRAFRRRFGQTPSEWRRARRVN